MITFRLIYFVLCGLCGLGYGQSLNHNRIDLFILVLTFQVELSIYYFHYYKNPKDNL